jgi:hypothetical protein
MGQAVTKGEIKECRITTGRLPIRPCDFDGYAYVCTRALKDSRDIRTYGGTKTNLGIYHAHIFFGKKVRVPSLGDKEWDNIGFSKQGLFEEPNNNGYICENEQYGNARIAHAVEFVIEKSTFGYRDGKTYDLLNHNCQDFVSDVLAAYKHGWKPSRLF